MSPSTCETFDRPVRDNEAVAARQDPIRMYPSDPSWQASFEEEQKRLSLVLAPWLVRPLEHIGSTAVPGLIAKPIIDIVAVVEEIDTVGEARVSLLEIGWLAAPEPGDDRERKLSFCTPSVELRTHHLHIVEQSSTRWRSWLAFRDYLRSHPEAAEEYGVLKQRLADENGADPNRRDRYRAGKDPWIRAITERALSEVAR
jgi:GrpB-like predicted nucleotidyltransferase (UPF0157 family)